MNNDPVFPVYVTAVASGPARRISRAEFEVRTRRLAPLVRNHDCPVTWHPFTLLGAQGALALPSSIVDVARIDRVDDMLFLTSPGQHLEVDLYVDRQRPRGTVPDRMPGHASLILAGTIFDYERLPSLDPALHQPATTRFYHGAMIRGCWDDDHQLTIRLQTRDLDLLNAVVASLELQRTED